ncbi:DUF4129 domain-containing protein [Dermacoccaceae bacterium W4C1]
MITARVLTEPPLDPSGAQGRELLSDELSRLAYADQRGPIERLMDWIDDVIQRFSGDGTGVLGKLLLLAVAVALVVLVIFVATRLNRSMRAPSHGPADAPVLEELHLSAAEYRQRAAAAQQRGEHGGALLDYFRAIARSGDERALLEDAAADTARELAQRLSQVFPDHAAALIRAAGDFDDVRYGERRVDAATATRMQSLDTELLRARPVHADTGHAGLVAPGGQLR